MCRIPLDSINELRLLNNIEFQSKKIYRQFKQAIDVVMAFVFFIITLPLWPFIMILIKIESHGSIFNKQEYIGYFGKTFKIIRFRTANTELTKVGKFLRVTRLENIPQLLNIIKCDVSFIGPCPDRVGESGEVGQKIPFYKQRLLVKPGLSGWDQVSGEYHSPSREDTYKKLQNDLYYIKNMSFFLDVSIFFKTLVTMFKRTGV
jgi:lipopolysaccharide/colanic/teichoic acid biosynthesis glycosyltransferase